MEHLQNTIAVFLAVLLLLIVAEVDDVENLNFFNFWMLIFFFAGLSYLAVVLEKYKDEDDKDQE